MRLARTVRLHKVVCRDAYYLQAGAQHKNEGDCTSVGCGP